MARPRRKPKPRGPYHIYTVHDVASLFGVSQRTIQSWTQAGLLDITSIEDVCRYYHERQLRKYVVDK